MMIKHIAIAFLCISLFTNTVAASSGVSPYLPLQLDPLIELEINKLVTIAKIPNLVKPYPAKTILKALAKVKHSHPILFNRINQYIERYKQKSAITHFSATVSHSFAEDQFLDNSRGATFDSLGQLTVTSFHQMNSYLIFNGGGTFIEGDGFVPHNSFISVGYEYAQFDIGYREHWLSPSQIAAPLLSTNAEPAFSITMSNITPISDWNIKYEMSLGLLEDMDGIHSEGETSSGQPALLTMHASIQPFDWWTIGANRTFMFGGGDRSLSLSDVWEAIIDPVNADNCGSGETDCENSDEEVGNQIASITSRFDLSYDDFPFSLYIEYAGEDTKDHKNYQLGNHAKTVAVFFPYLTANVSMYAEISSFQDAWYVHHIYDEGYTNNDVVMGHWWANDRVPGDNVGGSMATLRLNADINPEDHIEILLKQTKLDPSSKAEYQNSNELQITLRHMYNTGFISFSVIAGNDAFGNSFYNTRFNYTW